MDETDNYNSLLKRTLGENIRKIRESYGLSLNELSDYLGVTPGFLRLIENGKRGLTLDRMIMFTERFGITTDELLYKYADGKLAENMRITMLDKIVFLAKQLNHDELKRLAILMRVVFRCKG